MFNIQTRALLLVNITTCSINIDKYIWKFTIMLWKRHNPKIINRFLRYVTPLLPSLIFLNEKKNYPETFSCKIIFLEERVL